MKYNIRGLMSLPYTVNPDRVAEEEPQAQQCPFPGETEMDTMASTYPDTTSSAYEDSISPPTVTARHHAGSTASSQRPMITTIQRSDTISVPRGSKCVTIRITMPSSFGVRSWRWYEAVIETTAVGVYLYATFVLTSVVFLNADKAIVYATIMALCLSGMADEGKEELRPTTAADTEAAAAGQSEEQPQEQEDGKPPKEPGSAFLGGYGNSVGGKVSSTLSPVGKPLGKGLETVASPVGGLVEPLVGGIMKSGEGFGDTVGVGAGNQDKKKFDEAEKERAPVGGKEQTAGNPLGLNQAGGGY
ncbi:MAG: hypothetical protein Q9169_005100 [Polycauliona sp. 2 TL-2023]